MSLYLGAMIFESSTAICNFILSVDSMLIYRHNAITGHIVEYDYTCVNL